jgi:signal transduction histidine kinase
MPVVGSSTGLIVDQLGYLTGAVLYVMIVVLVARERWREGTPLLSRGGRLPLLTGVCGVTWNIGGLVTVAAGMLGPASPLPFVIAIAFSALGALPALVVHSLLEGHERAARRSLARLVSASAYALSLVAAAMHVAAALTTRPVPSPLALWLLTVGFAVLTTVLLLLTRQAPVGRRGFWVVALSVFAVSAMHFGRHGGQESWWVELIGHHASLPLALAILHQDYRFAFADLFLKNAVALLLLVGVTLGLFAGVLTPMLTWRSEAGTLDYRVPVVFIAAWIGTVLIFPLLRTLAARFVDRAVLRRVDYDQALGNLAANLDRADSVPAVVGALETALQGALGARDVREIRDPFLETDRRTVVIGPAARIGPESTSSAILRLQTVDPPHPALAVGPLAAGRRLLSDDLRLLEATSRLAARQIDLVRVSQERLDRRLREQRMHRLATEAELRALRAQLNPHFLFNALNTVGHLIQTAPGRAFQTLLRLTGLLRGVLHRSDHEFMSLGEEIDLVTSYLDIERARFEERLTVHVDVPADLRHQTVPVLLLQPIVENAVKHGIAARREGGHVRIHALAVSGRLTIEIIDNGTGFSAPDRPEGVGLSNIRQRLRAHYGDAAALVVMSEPGAGTTVLVELPLTTSDPAVYSSAGPSARVSL